MLAHYLLIFLRNFRKTILHHLINVLGLSTGLTCAIFLYLYSHDELTYDQFHKNHDRIYKVVDTYTFSDQPVNSATISAPMGPALVSHFPDIEMAIRINKVSGLIRPEKDETNEFQFERILVVDSGFTRLFSFVLLQGDPDKVLTEPNTVVLTETTSKKLFGTVNSNSQLLKTNLLGGRTMLVTGIIQDPPTNSHIQFDMLVSHASMLNVVTTLNNWLVYGTHTYILLKPEASPDGLQSKFKQLILPNIGPEMASKYNHHVVPLESIHLGISRRGDLEPGGSRTVVYIFIAVACLILFLVTANFISLSVSIASNRIKESGMRKALGSSVSQLARQFLLESCAISLAAAILALILASLLLPSFNLLSGKTFLTSQLFSLEVICMSLGIGIIIGIISGFFPALFLAQLKPIDSLKKVSSTAVFGGNKLRNTLVVLQFTVVIALLISITIIRDQLMYFRSHDVGFTKNNALIIPINSVLIAKNRVALISELSSLTGVSNVSTSSSLPSKNIGFGPFRLEGGSLDDDAILNVMSVDDRYFNTLELRLIAGRAFDRNIASDSMSFILNETAVQSLGIASAEAALDKKLEMYGTNKAAGPLKSGPIIGVIKNFHFKSLKDEIEPLVMQIGKGGYGWFLIRINSSSSARTLESIKNKWNEVEPNQSMVYSFLADDITKLYQSEEQLGSIFTVFNYLTVITGCIGLFGLSSYVILRKAKEISLRKVLGATPAKLMLNFGLAFLKLVAISFILACPIAYYVAQRWLESFAYHDTIKPMSFIMGGLIAFGITGLTVTYHAAKASLANPIKNLRSE